MRVRGAALSALLSAFASLALCGCGGGPRPDTPLKDAQPRPSEVAAAPTPSPTPREEMSVDDFFSKKLLPAGFDTATLLKVWGREPGRERYRLVRPEDFVITEEAKRAPYSPPARIASGIPFIWGDFDGNLGENLVLLVTDPTKEGPERFGVVLFKERKAGGYDVRWIYRDADFSHGLTVNRHSGDIYLTKFGPDGSQKSCDIGWSRAERKFTCHHL